MTFRYAGSGSPVKLSLLGAVALALLLAGCGKNDAERPAGQVIAHIGPDTVTIQELENEFRDAKVPPDKRDDAITKKALLEIVTRKAVARRAITAKLDREPTMQLELLRDKEQLLARVFMQRKLSSAVAGVGQSDIDGFIATHPTQFGKRVIFVTDQIQLPAEAVTDALVAATKDAKSLAEVEQKLNELKVPMRRSSGTLDAAVLPPQLTQRLQSQQGNDVFFTRVNGGAVFFKVVETQAKPLTGAEATNLARQMITQEKFDEMSRQAVKDAEQAATYEGDYAKIMTAAAPAK
jgi:EpsD family peptidyl-prolyl cis-trans isomerase